MAAVSGVVATIWLVALASPATAQVSAALSQTSTAPPITTPVPGSTLTSSTVTFQGGHTGADLQHWLYVGTSQGAQDLFSGNMGRGHTATVPNLPNSGTIWVRCWTLFSSGWVFSDQSYLTP